MLVLHSQLAVVGSWAVRANNLERFVFVSFRKSPAIACPLGDAKEAVEKAIRCRVGALGCRCMGPQDCQSTASICRGVEGGPPVVVPDHGPGAQRRAGNGLLD